MSKQLVVLGPTKVVAGWHGERQVRYQAHQGNPSALPCHHEQSPWHAEQSDFFRSTFKEPRGITTQHTTSYEAVMLSREATLSCVKEAPSDVGSGR
jgi:hypothetical protein